MTQQIPEVPYEIEGREYTLQKLTNVEVEIYLGERMVGRIGVPFAYRGLTLAELKEQPLFKTRIATVLKPSRKPEKAYHKMRQDGNGKCLPHRERRR